MHSYTHISYRLFSSVGACTNTGTISILPPAGVKGKLKHLFLTCKCLPSLRRLHARLLTLNALSIPSVASFLVTSYTCLHNPQSALAVFNSVPNPSISLCNPLIRLLAVAGHPQTAIILYNRMEQRGIHPDNYTFNIVLKACADALDTRNAVSVYEQIKRRRLTTDMFISTALLNLFSKLGLVSITRELLDSMPVVDAVAWNAVIAGFSCSKAPDEALHLFRKMVAAGEVPNSDTLLSLFPAVCHQLSALILCKEIHGFALKRGILELIFNGLFNAYCKCGRAALAHKVVDGMSSVKDDYLVE